jgi:hypothetical protein
LGKAAITSGENLVLDFANLNSSSVHSGLSTSSTVLSDVIEGFLRDRIARSLSSVHRPQTDGSQAAITYREGKNKVVIVDLAKAPVSWFSIVIALIHKRRA